jgi:hypothetical protein
VTLPLVLILAGPVFGLTTFTGNGRPRCAEAGRTLPR